MANKKSIEDDITIDPFNIDDKIIIKIYDFRRPDKFSFDQIRTLSMIHEKCARLVTAGLSDLLKTMVHIYTASVDQVTYEEFIRSVPNPTCLGIINMSPLKGSAVLAIDDSLTFSIIDRLMGGKGKYEDGFYKVLTDIESELMKVIISKFLKNLNQSWENILPLQAKVNNIEINPCFAQIVPPKDMIVFVTFEASIGGINGYINLCLPYITIEPIIPKLSAKYWFTAARKKTPVLSNKISNIKLDIKTVIKGEKLSLKQINELTNGSLIKLENYDQGNAYIFSSGKPIVKLKQLNEKKRNNYEFEIINEQKLNEWPLNNYTENIKPDNILNKSLTKLADSFNKTFDKINDKIEKLNEKQDVVVDQLSFTIQNPDLIEDMSYTVNKNKPFDFLRLSNPLNLLNFIKNEHPQTIALILSYLEAGQASSILTGLSEELQSDIIERIAEMDRTSPDILHKVENILEIKLKILEKEMFITAGGIQSVVDILNFSPRKIETNIIKKLEKSNPKLSESIKKNMFVFEDISTLDKNTLKMILENINIEELVIALKAVKNEIKKKIISVLKTEDQKNINEKINSLGKIRLKIVEEAQQKIIEIIKNLEESGLIIINKSNEEII